jgi:membrane protein implicated in regulation of membrane protease activity
VESVFLICAIVGGIVLVFQFAAAVLGLVGDHDLDHHDFSHEPATSWFAGLISFRSVITGVTFFGLAGIAALSRGADDLTALGVAALGGAAALYVMAQVMLGLRRLGSDGTARVERAVGKTGTVYVPIPGGNAGPGKVTLTVQKRTVEYAAYTAGDGLPTGARVRVVAVRGPTAVDVEPAGAAAGESLVPLTPVASPPHSEGQP